MVEPIQNASPVDRASLDVDAHSPIVLWVGRLDPVKGLSFLLEAFRLVAAGSRAHLLIAGDGPIGGTLQKKAADLGLASRVHFLGTRDDVPGLLKAADVFVFPSRTEGLPNAVLEAMVAGCAVVTTDVPGCRDLVMHRESGLLVPYSDTLALAESILHLLRDRELAARLGGRAAQIVTSLRGSPHMPAQGSRREHRTFPKHPASPVGTLPLR